MPGRRAARAGPRRCSWSLPRHEPLTRAWCDDGPRSAFRQLEGSTPRPTARIACSGAGLLARERAHNGPVVVATPATDAEPRPRALVGQGSTTAAGDEAPGCGVARRTGNSSVPITGDEKTTGSTVAYSDCEYRDCAENANHRTRMEPPRIITHTARSGAPRLVEQPRQNVRPVVRPAWHRQLVQPWARCGLGAQRLLGAGTFGSVSGNAPIPSCRVIGRPRRSGSPDTGPPNRGKCGPDTSAVRSGVICGV